MAAGAARRVGGIIVIMGSVWENLISVLIFPFYAVGWVAGKVARMVEIAWSTVRLGFLEARGGNLGEG